jgi:hypothetical protein
MDQTDNPANLTAVAAAPSGLKVLGFVNTGTLDDIAETPNIYKILLLH